MSKIDHPSLWERHWQPGRLWSLWDMLKLDASAFYAAVTSIARLQAAAKAVQHQPGYKPTGKLSTTVQSDVLAKVRTLQTALGQLGAPITVMAAQDFAESLSKSKVSFGGLHYSCREISASLERELKLAEVFILDPNYAKYFSPKRPVFGQIVADRLPQAVPDIEDAGKCLALAQGTASVFHSMRVMEAALKQLAKMLGIPYAPSWESYISQINTKIADKHKTKGVRWKKDEPFYRDIAGDLQTIKIAWRNPTMHIVRRYTVEEAEEIYRAVRGFVQRLAPRLPKSEIEKLVG